MKKLLLILTLLITVVVTSGYMLCDYKVNIGKNHDMLIKETNGLYKNTIKTYGAEKYKQDLKTNVDTLRKNGYEVNAYNEDEVAGLTARKTFDIEKFSKENLPNGFFTEEENPVKINKHFMGKREYSIKWLYSIKPLLKKYQSEDSKIDYEENDSYEEIQTSSSENEQPQAVLTINLPVKATKNNADSINFNSYTWNLTKADSVPIVLEYEEDGNEAVLGIVFTVLLLLGLIVVFQKLKE